MKRKPTPEPRIPAMDEFIDYELGKNELDGHEINEALRHIEERDLFEEEEEEDDEDFA